MGDIRLRFIVPLVAAVVPAPFAAPGAYTSDPVPQTRAVAAGVWLVPEVHVEGREPDGNSVIFEGPQGLIAVDSGRHRWHQSALQLAEWRRQPIVAPPTPTGIWITPAATKSCAIVIRNSGSTQRMPWTRR